MLVLLHCCASCCRLGVCRLRLLVPVARTAGRQLRGLLAIVVPAGCRVLQTAEFGAVAGGHRAAAVSFASSHPPSSAGTRLDPRIDVNAERKVSTRVREADKSPIESFSQAEIHSACPSERQMRAPPFCHPLTERAAITGAPRTTWLGAMGGAASLHRVPARHIHLGSFCVVIFETQRK